MQDEENRRIYEVKQCSGSNSSVVGAEWDVERVKLRAERTGAERTGPHDAGRPIASRAGPLALFRSPPLILALPAFQSNSASGYCYCCHCSLAAYQSFSLERERETGALGAELCCLPPTPFPICPWMARPELWWPPIHPHPEPRASLGEHCLLSNHRQEQIRCFLKSDRTVNQIGQEGEKKEGSLITYPSNRTTKRRITSSHHETRYHIQRARGTEHGRHAPI
jgi:hypothetical protein